MQVANAFLDLYPEDGVAIADKLLEIIRRNRHDNRAVS